MNLRSLVCIFWSLILAVAVLAPTHAFAQDDETEEGAKEAGSGKMASPDPPPDETDEARRKRLARLGSGKVSEPPPVGKVYSLDAMVERAMEVNPELVARKHTELYARYRKEQANWAVGPRISFDSTLTAVPNNTDFNEIKSNVDQYLELDVGPLTRNNLRIVFPLFTFGKISSARELADLGIDQAEIESRKKRLKLVRQLKEAYYSVQLGKRIQAIMKDGIATIKEEIVRQDEAREFGDEDVDVVEFRKLQIYEADLDGRVIDTERLVRLTKAALGVLADLELDSFDVAPFDEDVDTTELPTLTNCTRLARENRPDAILLDKAIVAREKQKDIEVAKFYPDFFFAMDFGYGFSTSKSTEQVGTATDENGNTTAFAVEPLFDPYNFTRWAFAVGLRLNLEPGQQYWKYRQAEAKLAETRALRSAALEGIDLEIEKQYVETDDLRRKLEILERRFKAADRWRTQIAVAFSSGGADLQDFLAPLKAWYEARLLLLQARYDYKVAVAKLSELVGVEDIVAVGRDLEPVTGPSPGDLPDADDDAP